MIKLVTSNENKIAEFNRFGLPVVAVKGLDLREVKSDSLTVVIHKAIEAGEGNMVEDTVLTIEGKEVVDIRYCLEDVSTEAFKKATWKVSLCVQRNGQLEIAQAEVHGTIGPDTSSAGEEVFGFDGIFYPDLKDDASIYSLHQLEKQGKKDLSSARRLAVEAFVNKSDGYRMVPVSSIAPWSGEYQS